MSANPEFALFARLVESLRPWLDQTVVVGGWAHRLYRLHPLAQQLRYEPLATLDADIALPARLKVTGDEIYQRLASNGFEAEFVGHHKPPAAHSRLTDPGIEFYAEFVAPLAGSTVSRTGKPKATHRVGGISSQNLRYVEILLARPWSVTLFANNGFPLANELKCRSQIPSVSWHKRYSFMGDGIARTARRIFSTCMTRSRLSLRELTSCALNGRTSGPSFTRTAFALCSAQGHWY